MARCAAALENHRIDCAEPPHQRIFYFCLCRGGHLVGIGYVEATYPGCSAFLEDRVEVLAEFRRDQKLVADFDTGESPRLAMQPRSL